MDEYWTSCSERQRMAMSSAPYELLEPVRELLNVVLERLKNPVTDSLGRHHTFLKGTQAAFRLTHVGEGLFIGALTLDANGAPKHEVDSIQLPDNEAVVNPDTIYILRGIFPITIRKASEHIRNASRITENEWNILVVRAPKAKVPEVA